MQKTELQFHPSTNCLKGQTDINAKMRLILVEWLIEVHLKFKLLPETLFLTINLMDRYCMVKQVLRNEYQLLGVTAMLIASKYEEIYPPEIRDFVHITDK
jgi:cyclin B